MSQVWVMDAVTSVFPKNESPPKELDRPPAWEERASNLLLHALSPRLPDVEAQGPPPHLAPFTSFEIDRRHAPGKLAAKWYPAPGTARGAVLLVHPWVPWGQAYFYRRGRLQALRKAGYHVLSFDLGGIADSGPRPSGFLDTDVEAALDALVERAGDLPIHLWGVSAGGYYSHFVLSRRADVSGAFFEDVPSHLLVWSRREAPWGLPAYLFFEHVFRRSYRYFDLRHHAARLKVQEAAYASGELDRGARADEARELARLAGGTFLEVPGAGHLDTIRRGGRSVISLALSTFERAESRDGSLSR